MPGSAAAIRSGAPVGAISDAQQEPINPDVARAQAFVGQASFFGGLMGIGGPDVDAITKALVQLKIDPRSLPASSNDPKYMEQLGKLLKPYEQQLQAQLKMPGKDLGEMRAALSQQLAGSQNNLFGTSPFDTQSLPQLVEQLTKGQAPQGPGDPQQRTPAGPHDQMDSQAPPQAPPQPQPPATRPQPAHRHMPHAGVGTPSRTPKRPAADDDSEVGAPKQPVRPSDEPDADAVRAKEEPASTVVRDDKAKPDAPDVRDDGAARTAPAATAPNATRPDFGNVAAPSKLLTSMTEPKDFNAAVLDLWDAKDFKPPPKNAAAPTQEELDSKPHLKSWYTLRGSASNQHDNLWKYSPEAQAFYKRMFTPPADTAK